MAEEKEPKPAPKKVLTEDVYADGAWAASFRKGDEVDEATIKLWHLEDKVEDPEDADKPKRASRRVHKDEDEAPKSTDRMINPSPDSPQGGANDPNRNAI